MAHRSALRRVPGSVLAALAFLTLAAPAADAHHAMGGKTPATFFEGLLSGLAHPILGPDHLLFLAAAAAIIAVLRFDLKIAAAFIVATLAGVALCLAGVDIPLGEAAVALTIVALGLAAFAPPRTARHWLAFFAVAGVLHGHAFGESIVGGGAAVFVGYLIGLAVIETAIVAGAGHLARKFDLSEVFGLRRAGSLVAVAGVVLLVVALRTGA